MENNYLLSIFSIKLESFLVICQRLHRPRMLENTVLPPYHQKKIKITQNKQLVKLEKGVLQFERNTSYFTLIVQKLHGVITILLFSSRTLTKSKTKLLGGDYYQTPATTGILWFESQSSCLCFRSLLLPLFLPFKDPTFLCFLLNSLSWSISICSCLHSSLQKGVSPLYMKMSLFLERGFLQREQESRK